MPNGIVAYAIVQHKRFDASFRTYIECGFFFRHPKIWWPCSLFHKFTVSFHVKVLHTISHTHKSLYKSEKGLNKNMTLLTSAIGSYKKLLKMKSETAQKNAARSILVRFIIIVPTLAIIFHLAVGMRATTFWKLYLNIHLDLKLFHLISYAIQNTKLWQKRTAIRNSASCMWSQTANKQNDIGLMALHCRLLFENSLCASAVCMCTMSTVYASVQIWTIKCYLLAPSSSSSALSS